MAGNPWLRTYHEDLDDRRLSTLSDQDFRFHYELQMVTCRYGGTLPNADDIAFTLRRKVKEVESLLKKHRQLGLLVDIDGAIELAGWRSRQFSSDSSAERVRKFRERLAQSDGNVSGNVTGNVTGNAAASNGNVVEQNRTEKNRGWKRFSSGDAAQPDKKIVGEQKKEAARIAGNWPEPLREPMQEEFTPAEICQWFADADVSLVPERACRVAKAFHRDWITNQYRARLARATGGECIIELKHRVEGAA